MACPSLLFVLFGLAHSGHKGRAQPPEIAARQELVGRLAQALRANQYLTHLDLSRNRLDDACAEPIANAVLKSHVLASLSLAGNRLTSASVPPLAGMVKRAGSLSRLSLADNAMLFDGVLNPNTGKPIAKAASQFLGHGLRSFDASATGMSGAAALACLKFCTSSMDLRCLKLSRNNLRAVSAGVTQRCVPDMAIQGTSVTRLYLEETGLLDRETSILLNILASAPENCKLNVWGHGLEGAAAMRAGNAARKDHSHAKLKCCDCNQYKSLKMFLTPAQCDGLSAKEFASYMNKSMRGLMRCKVCNKKRREALDRAMGRTIEILKYGMSSPQVRHVSSLWRMNQFVSPERIKQRNRKLARDNAAMRSKALSDYESSMKGF